MQILCIPRVQWVLLCILFPSNLPVLTLVEIKRRSDLYSIYLMYVIPTAKKIWTKNATESSECVRQKCIYLYSIYFLYVMQLSRQNAWDKNASTLVLHVLIVRYSDGQKNLGSKAKHRMLQENKESEGGSEIHTNFLGLDSLTRYRRRRVSRPCARASCGRPASRTAWSPRRKHHLNRYQGWQRLWINPKLVQ